MSRWTVFVQLFVWSGACSGYSILLLTYDDYLMKSFVRSFWAWWPPDRWHFIIHVFTSVSLQWAGQYWVTKLCQCRVSCTLGHKCFCVFYSLFKMFKSYIITWLGACTFDIKQTHWTFLVGNQSVSLSGSTTISSISDMSFSIHLTQWPDCSKLHEDL